MGNIKLKVTYHQLVKSVKTTWGSHAGHQDREFQRENDAVEYDYFKTSCPQATQDSALIL